MHALSTPFTSVLPPVFPRGSPSFFPYMLSLRLPFSQMFSSRKAIRCYLKSRPPAKDAKNCAGADCDDVGDLSASLAIARAKKMRDLMIGSHDIGRWIIPSARDHGDPPNDEDSFSYTPREQ